MKEPQPGIYRHYKGGTYEVVGVATHSETLERLVVYRSMKDQGGMWVRPLSMFTKPWTWMGAPCRDSCSPPLPADPRPKAWAGPCLGLHPFTRVFPGSSFESILVTHLDPLEQANHWQS